jgi:hypothetical protein
MSPAGFEPAILASKRPQTLALHLESATNVGNRSERDKLHQNKRYVIYTGNTANSDHNSLFLFTKTGELNHC